MISVILIEPEHPGNIGAIARVMANFGIKNLCVINPKVQLDDDAAIARSKHAKDILKNAKDISYEELKQFDLLIATSARLCSDYNLMRTPLTPHQLADQLKSVKGNIGLVFGRESNGLTNEEIALCDFIVTIPATRSYSALNISHACSIILYEIFRQSTDEKNVSRFTIPTSSEKEILLKKMDGLLTGLRFTTTKKEETQRKFWHRIISKSFMSKRETYIFLGFTKRVEDELKKKK